MQFSSLLKNQMMENREEERKLLCQRIEQLENQDKTIRDTITKEKLQYDVCIYCVYINMLSYYIYI